MKKLGSFLALVVVAGLFLNACGIPNNAKSSRKLPNGFSYDEPIDNDAEHPDEGVPVIDNPVVAAVTQPVSNTPTPANPGTTPTTPPAVTPPPAPALPPNTVQFIIPAGTANGSWNTIDSPMVGKVGNTLILKNEDTSAPGKRVHAAGVPFAHMKSDIPVNGQVSITLGAATNGVVRLYNHNVSTAAAFYIKVDP